MENLENKTKEQLLKEIEETKEKLQESESKYKALFTETQRFRDALDKVPSYVYMKDIHSRYIYANQLTLDLFKCSAKELIGFDDSEFFPPDTAKRLLEIDSRVFNGETTHEEIDALDEKGKGNYYVEVKSPIVEEPNGNKIVGLIGISTDITERKKAEDKIIFQRNKLDRILEGTNAGTWDWNIPSGECVFNERWAEIMGYSLEELMPVDINTWINNVHPDDLPMANSMLDKLFNKTLDYLDIVFRQPHKDGNWVWVNARGKVVDWSEEGKPLRISGTHLDITKQMQGQEELRKYREHLEETVKQRTAEVDEKNKKLSDQMKVFVGRELKIKDLEMRIIAFEGK